MHRMAAVGFGFFCLVAGASTPTSGVQEERQAKTVNTAREQPAPGSQVTLEKLDRYIQYRRESDPIILGMGESMLQESANKGGSLMSRLAEMKKLDEAVRAKYGLSGEDFTRLDRMVRDICEARFMPDSAANRAMLQRFQEQAAGPRSDERSMAQGMLAMLRKQMEEGPRLVRQRKDYGDATVDLVLRREKELKEIWVRKDAATARALEALNAPPPKP